MTNPIIKDKSYTNKDYETIRNAIVEAIPLITDEWTDFNESEPGMAYLEIASGIADMLFYYLDKQALENYLITAQQRKNVKGIFSSVGYKMSYYLSSVCTVKISLEEPHAYDIVIPMYTKLIANQGTQHEYQFATMEEVKILAGDTEVEVYAKEGVLKNKTITVDQIERFMYRLPDLAIEENSVKVEVDVGDGIELEEVIDIFLHGMGGLHFSTDDDKDGYTWISFMPDWKDHVTVSDETEIYISYLISSGVKGRARVGELNDFHNETIRDVDGNTVTELLSVVNIESASGGSDPETIKEASYKGPREVQTMWTAVTLRDFVVLAESVQGIRLVNAIDWSDHYGYYTTPSTVEICLVPEVGDVVSEFLKEELTNLLDNRKLVALDVILINPAYIRFNLSAKVVITSRSYSKAEVAESIRNNLREIYSSATTVFNEHIRNSRIVSAIHNSHTSVSYVKLNSINAWKKEYLLDSDGNTVFPAKVTELTNRNPLDDIVLKSNELPMIDEIYLDLLYEDEVGG